jgi:pSer/pThr/pTyr-binding forkhead associated (FHA) protein
MIPNFGIGTQLVICLPDGTTPYIFKVAAIEQLTIGRYDTATRTVPMIDLTPYHALQNGVSRNHAIIKWQDHHTLGIEDQNSQNGTYLNGHQLVPHKSQPLRDGDHLRIGSLVLHLKFEQPDKRKKPDIPTGLLSLV